MALVPARCTQCGGAIEVDNTQEAGVCKHCGTAFITEKAINNYTTNYNITNNVTKIVNGKDSDDDEEEFNKGLVHLKTKKYDQARRCFDKAIRKRPEVSKYYFYWCVAESKNFEEPNAFIGEGYKYDLSEDREDFHDMDSFFALTTKEECEALSNEFGINLNEGTDGLIEWVFKKYSSKFINNRNFMVFIKKMIDKVSKDSGAHQAIVDCIVEKAKVLAVGCYKTIQGYGGIDAVSNMAKNEIFDIVTYLIDNKWFPNYDGGRLENYLEAIELAAQLDKEYYESVQQSKNTIIDKQNNKNYKAFKEKFITNTLYVVLGVVVGLFLVLYFGKAFSIYNSETYVKGVTDIVKAPFKSAALISLGAGAGITVLATLIFLILKRDKK